MTVASSLRRLGLARCAVGGLSLLALGRRHRVGTGRLPRVAVVAGRVLAVRDVAQGAMLVNAPEARTARLGATIDTLHGLSMLPVITSVPRLRRPALVSALTAAAWVSCAQALAGRRR